MSRISTKKKYNDSFVEIEKRTEVYRRCILGKTLFSSLQELLDERKLTPSLANTVMDQFDRSVSLILQDLPCNYEAVFEAGEIISYSLFGDQWAIKLKDAIFNFVDQEVCDDISRVPECVIYAVNPTTFTIDLRMKRNENVQIKR